MFKDLTHFAELCLKLQYQFRNPRLLAQAITTETAYRMGLQQPAIGHQEELEFLGDGVLKLVANNLLVKEFAGYGPAFLSSLRDNIIRNSNLAEAAEKMELGKYIFTTKLINFKILADTMEAIIGAIYKDSGENIQEVTRFILCNANISSALKQQKAEEEKRYRPLLTAIEKADVKTVRSELRSLNPNYTIILHKPYTTEHKVSSEEATREVDANPLSLAIDALEESVRQKRNVQTSIDIIAALLQRGADVNLELKHHEPFIYRLITPICREKGNVIDAEFVEFIENSATSPELKAFIDMKDEKEVAEWSETTDKVIPLFCKAGLDLHVKTWRHSILERTILFNEFKKWDLFLAAGSDPTEPNEHGDTPLHKAATLARMEFIKKLLAAKVRVNYRNKKGETPFDAAKTVAVKKILIKAEIDEQHSDSKQPDFNRDKLNHEGITLYKEAIAKKSKELHAKAIAVFTQILQHDVKILPHTDTRLISYHYNLGSAYLQHENYQQATCMLDRAHVLSLLNHGDHHSETTKMNKRLTECKERLAAQKEYERETSDATWNHHRLFSAPSEIKHEGVAKQLADNDARDEKLFQATAIHQADTVDKLLKNGANPNAIEKRSGKNQPILHFAIIQYQAMSLSVKATPELSASFTYKLMVKAREIINLLLTSGADVNKTDHEGKTTMHLVASSGQLELIELLLKSGANVTLTDHKGNFASHLATSEPARLMLLTALQKQHTAPNPAKIKVASM